MLGESPNSSLIVLTGEGMSVQEVEDIIKDLAQAFLA